MRAPCLSAQDLHLNRGSFKPDSSGQPSQRQRTSEKFHGLHHWRQSLPSYLVRLRLQPREMLRSKIPCEARTSGIYLGGTSYLPLMNAAVGFLVQTMLEMNPIKSRAKKGSYKQRNGGSAKSEGGGPRKAE